MERNRKIIELTAEKIAELESAWAHRDAFYSEAILLYDINLTKDLIEKELYESVDGRLIPLLPLVGMHAPCSYTLFLQLWGKTHVAPEDRKTFMKDTSRERLLSRCMKGKKKLRFEFHSMAAPPNGEHCLMCLTVNFTKNNSGDIIARCVIKDITEQRNIEIHLQEELHQAVTANQRLQFEDELTGFPNKRGFVKSVREILEKKPESDYAICYADIQNLNYVNSTYGYEIGSRLLRFFSQCIAGLQKEVNIVGRVSGGHFATLIKISSESQRKQLEESYKILCDRMRDYCHTIDRHFLARVYAGIYLILPEDIKNMDIERMLDRAAIAQETAKRNGEQRLAYYNDKQWEIRRRQISICQLLNDALANNEVEAWLQPQCDYERGKITGAEVLCRWNSSVLGAISPGEFIPVLEASGQVYELDLYIWEKACSFLRQWLDNGKSCVPLSVNISRHDINNPEFMEQLLGLLKKYRLSPDKLRLEITESAYMDEPEKLIGIAERLRDKGFTIEMDDFGSGFSSLNMLKEVPVDVLKMDLRFLAHNGQSKKGGNIISSVIRMAQALNLEVIAEGVETSEQAEALRSMGCSVMQGFLFSKAVPLPAFEVMLGSLGTEKPTEKTSAGNISYIYEIMDNSSKSSYIFQHFSSSTAVLEYDGTHLEVMAVNDEYLRTIGDYDAATRRYMQDALALVSLEDRQKALLTVKQAVEKGRASCELYYPSTGQWASITYRHVFKGQAAHYLFSEAVNTSESHRLSDEIKRISTEMNDKIDMLPVGTFRYDADGKQEFDFISVETAMLLNYPSVDALREKFHNNFPEFVYYEDRERVLKEIDEQIADNGHKDYCEYRVETGDGKLKWVFDHGHYVTDENGRHWYYVAIADMDHIKRERDEQELISRKFKALLQIPGVPVFDYDVSENQTTVYTSDGTRHESFLLTGFLNDWGDPEWKTTPDFQKVREIISKAHEAIVSGEFQFEGRIDGDNSKKYICHFSSMQNEKSRHVLGFAIPQN